MDDSMPQGPISAWKSKVGLVFAVVIGVVFLGAGLWKLTSPIDWAARLIQMKVPGSLSLPTTLAVGIGDMLAGVMLFLPRYRRLGGWLAAVLLLVYMGYFGINYNTLRGEECSCFPWLKRTVGPAFFVVDTIWMLMALAASWWAAPALNLRGAAKIAAVICVFAGVSYGVNSSAQSGLKAPDTVAVDGKPVSLQFGRVFLYFYDPECMHCFAAAKQMSGYHWKDVRVIAVPTRVPHFAQQFLNDTGLKAPIASDVEALRAIFKFGDPPYAVMLENGRQKEGFIQFDEVEPRSTLTKRGYIE